MIARLLFPVLLLALCGCGSQQRSWHDNGVLQSEGRVGARGHETGVWTYWYPEGELRERGTWDAGRREGTWTQWYPTGQRHSTGERRWDAESGAAPREGLWRFWYSNGQTRAVGNYERGEPVGAWTWWNHLGEVDHDRSGIYEHGARRDP